MNDALRDLGSMMMLGVRGASPGGADLEADLDACAHAGVRAVILFDRDVATGGDRNIQAPDQLRRLTDHIRARLGDGAYIAVDQEGGRVQRLSARHGFAGWPSPHDFALLDADAQRECARSMAGVLGDSGVDLNFAPCVDVGVYPESPVIGALGRSFGADAERVTDCARTVIDVHREFGVACVLKHFPGHGSARVDSHADLTDITATWERDRELAPYRALVGERVGVMTGHLVHRALDTELPATLSHAVTTGLLRTDLGFSGPVFTDALDMEGVRARWSLEECLVLALEAGADVLVHACNSVRAETAVDVVRAMERVASTVADLPVRAHASRRRLDALLA